MATPERASVDSTPAGPAPKVRDLFAARLGNLDQRIARELERGAASLGPAGQFVLDATREAWRAGSAVAEAVFGGRGLGALLASAMAPLPLDELGFDRALASLVRDATRPLARVWLSMHEHRSAPLPSAGGVLVVMNRSAWPLPVEPLVLASFLADGRLGDRTLAAAWQPLPELPFASDLLRRLGIVEATADNARALLERGAVLLAFPEGDEACGRTYDRRYRTAPFGDAGLFAAARDAGACVVPGAVVGNEEGYALLGRIAGWPVTPQFPLLGPLGLLPLPIAWSLRLGPAIAPAAADSAEALADVARARVSGLLAELLAERSAGRRG